jgi:hypothetical protein
MVLQERWAEGTSLEVHRRASTWVPFATAWVQKQGQTNTTQGKTAGGEVKKAGRKRGGGCGHIVAKVALLVRVVLNSHHTLGAHSRTWHCTVRLDTPPPHSLLHAFQSEVTDHLPRFRMNKQQHVRHTQDWGSPCSRYPMPSPSPLPPSPLSNMRTRLILRMHRLSSGHRTQVGAQLPPPPRPAPHPTLYHIRTPAPVGSGAGSHLTRHHRARGGRSLLALQTPV